MIELTKFNWSKIVIKTIIRININKLFYNYKFYKIRKICQAKYITFLQEVPSRSLDYAYFVWRITMWYTYINQAFFNPLFFSLVFPSRWRDSCFSRDRHQRHQVRHEDQVICNLSIRCPEPRSFHRGVDSWVTFPCQPVASFCSWNSLVY